MGNVLLIAEPVRLPKNQTCLTQPWTIESRRSASSNELCSSARAKAREDGRVSQELRVARVEADRRFGVSLFSRLVVSLFTGKQRVYYRDRAF